MTNLSEEILSVAIQHREDEVGHGFPKNLVKEKQHPYSRLSHGVIEFLEYTSEVTAHKEMQTAMTKFYSFQRKKISSQVIKSLFILFNVEVPKDLVSVLLPYDSARMT